MMFCSGSGEINENITAKRDVINALGVIVNAVCWQITGFELCTRVFNFFS